MNAPLGATVLDEEEAAATPGALTRAGQHVLCFVETYTPSRQLIQGLLARFGVERHAVSQLEHRLALLVDADLAVVAVHAVTFDVDPPGAGGRDRNGE